MKNIIYFWFLIIPVLLEFTGCEFGVPEETSTIISGQIVESVSGNPVSNASVKITDGITQANTTTNSQGKFTVDFSLKEDKELTVIAFKEGYTTDTIKVFTEAGSTTNVPIIQLELIQGTGGNGSGPAASIYLYYQSAQSIGVKESGSNETAEIIFEVLDSAGVPIDSDNSVLVNFSFGSSPGGGEFLHPASVQSNALGRASVTLNTGTKAGVAQIIADFTINGNNVKSRPVLIAIHGGFPDPDHFDVASDRLNYPQWGIIGYEIDFTAFVGDKYSNPVRSGTAVYFETTSGIIEGSNLTDDLGKSTVTLLTQPFPVLDETGYGAGFFRVTASTIDENNTNIQTSTVRLLTGLPVISVDPSTFDISNGGSQFFNYTVSDANGNPLSEGQGITVTIAEGDLEVYGDINVRLLDTQSSAFTMFSFTAYDSKPDTLNPHQAIIDIETSGPNGEKKYSIYGNAR